MSLPLLIAFLSIVTLGILAISSSIREDKAKKRLQALEAERNRKQFEEELLAEINDSLDYTIDVHKIVSIMVKKMDVLLAYTTVSSLIIKENQLICTIHANEQVSHLYTDKVKEQMLESLAELEKRSFREVAIREDISGELTDTPINPIITSSFKVPLLIHNSVVAILSVTSFHENRFPPEDIAVLQRIIEQTNKSLSKFDTALQIEKGRLTAMAESLTDGLFMVDTQNNLQLINPAAKHLLSLHTEPVTTMDVLSALPINFDFRGKMQAAIHENQTGEIAGVTIKNKQLRCGISPVRSSTGKVLGVSVIMKDETLKNSVPRMKEDFTNIIVHELRNPLTSIKASSELLISPIQFSPEEQRKLINLIYQQSNKLLTDVQQILDAAKLEAGVFTIHKRSSDLKELIKNVTETFKKEAQDKALNFLVDIDPHLPNFSFDAKYISLALTNIISNSLKFTSSGGTVQVIAKQKHASAIITIADTGAGIPKDKQHKLFNKFSQIEDASATVGKGLGLYMVKGITQAHGGNIDIDSDRGRGTTIFLTLPLTDATHMNASPPQTGNDSHRIVN